MGFESHSRIRYASNGRRTNSLSKLRGQTCLLILARSYQIRNCSNKVEENLPKRYNIVNFSIFDLFESDDVTFPSTSTFMVGNKAKFGFEKKKIYTFERISFIFQISSKKVIMVIIAFNFIN